jgi:hypothetical protein
MNVKDMFKGISPLATEKFLAYMKQTIEIITRDQDQLSPDDYCEILEFFGPKIQNWGDYTSIDNDRDHEPINVLYSGIFTICLDNIKKHIVSKTITIPQLLRVMDAMYPYDLCNICVFGDDELAVGDHIHDLIRFNDGKTYLILPLLSLQKTLGELSVYQFVFEHFLSFIRTFEAIRLFATCPDIIYKQCSGILNTINIFTTSRVSYSSFILSQIGKEKNQKKKKEWIQKLLEDQDVNPLIKEKIRQHPDQLD